MALAALKAQVKPAQTENKAVEVRGEEMHFRSPLPTDFYFAPSRIEALTRDFPRLRGTQQMIVLVIGGCYLRPDAEQGQGTSDADFAYIACNDIQLWKEIIDAFNGAFPNVFAAGKSEEATEDEAPFETAATPSPSGA